MFLDEEAIHELHLGNEKETERDVILNVSEKLVKDLLNCHDPRPFARAVEDASDVISCFCQREGGQLRTRCAAYVISHWAVDDQNVDNKITKTQRSDGLIVSIEPSVIGSFVYLPRPVTTQSGHEDNKQAFFL